MIGDKVASLILEVWGMYTVYSNSTCAYVLCFVFRMK